MDRGWWRQGHGGCVRVRVELDSSRVDVLVSERSIHDRVGVSVDQATPCPEICGFAYDAMWAAALAISRSLPAENATMDKKELLAQLRALEFEAATGTVSGACSSQRNHDMKSSGRRRADKEKRQGEGTASVPEGVGHGCGNGGKKGRKGGRLPRASAVRAVASGATASNAQSPPAPARACAP